MAKRLIYLSWLLVFFSSCEEYYTPAIDKIDGQLVVDALITNDVTKNYVHLTRTRDFYSNLPNAPVLGAKIELIDGNGTKVESGNETIPGNFTFRTIPVVGKSYKLRILIGQDLFESEVVTMPPVPTISNFYTGDKVQRVYRTDSYGVPIAFDIQGREIYIDAPATNALSHYRFYTRSIIEWSYTPAAEGPPPPTRFGWKSFYEKARFNLAGPKKFSAATAKIEQHPLLMLSYNAQDYLHFDSLTSNGWILIIDQYGTSAGSFDYHEELNKQFAADGNLFDPIQTQIYGNITCKTDPSKIVFGYFDLNSYRQMRYYMNLFGPDSPVIIRKLFRYPIIPDEGETRGYPPGWWE